MNSRYHLEANFMLLTTFDPFTRDFDRIVGRAFGPTWTRAFRATPGSAMPMDAVTQTLAADVKPFTSC